MIEACSTTWLCVVAVWIVSIESLNVGPYLTPSDQLERFALAGRRGVNT